MNQQLVWAMPVHQAKPLAQVTTPGLIAQAELQRGIPGVCNWRGPTQKHPQNWQLSCRTPRKFLTQVFLWVIVMGYSSIFFSDSQPSIGYGSIPINTIFSGMNIHKSQLFWGSLGTRVLTHPQFRMIQYPQ